jgi:hypothetical protein
VILFAAVAAPRVEAADRVRRSSDWPAVMLANAMSHVAIEASLEGASRWLLGERCQTVLSEFHDAEGRPVGDKLASLGVDIQKYLRLVRFYEGSAEPQCADGSTVAFTSRGSRVVFVCSRRFVQEWLTNREVGKAIVLHETLHSLGLGENPPSSVHITSRVLALCTGRQSLDTRPGAKSTK